MDSIDPVLMACQDCLKGHSKHQGHVCNRKTERPEKKNVIKMSVLCSHKPRCLVHCVGFNFIHFCC